MTASEDTLRRVRALLAKEGAGGTTPQEVAASLALAARLMESAGITRAALELEGSPDAEPAEELREFADPLFDGGAARWRLLLGTVLAKGFGCASYLNGKRFIILGRASDADTVRYLFAYCDREIQRVARLHCAGEGRVYGSNFRLGCVIAIREAIQRERQAERDAQRAAAGTGSALVRIDQAIARLDSRQTEADAFMRAAVPGLRKNYSKARPDHGARAAGMAAGRSIYPGAGRSARIGSGPARVAGLLG